MAKDPAYRYATAEELRADLLRFNEGRSVQAMDEATAMIGVAGATTVVAAAAGMDATRAVGAVGGTGGTAAVGAEGDAPDESGSNRTRNYAIILGILIVILLLSLIHI